MRRDPGSPTTRRSACSAAFTRAGQQCPSSTTSGPRCPALLPSTSGNDLPQRLSASPPGSQPGGHAGAHPNEVGYSQVVTTSSYAPVRRAWFAAHLRASMDGFGTVHPNDDEADSQCPYPGHLPASSACLSKQDSAPRWRSAGPRGPRPPRCATADPDAVMSTSG